MNPLIKIIKFYQEYITPYTGRHCRFYPTCSQYSITSLKKYGFWRGLWKSTKRISRCHPWNKGGIDLP
ncbi:MAG: membrane protein insertion efficiency factor YidD [Candidatus Paceibacterota bacterium]